MHMVSYMCVILNLASYLIGETKSTQFKFHHNVSSGIPLMGTTPNIDIFSPVISPLPERSEIVLDEFGNLFRVNLDVHQFRPNEISVNVVNNSIVVTGKHEELKDDHGFVSEEISRRFLIPKGVDNETVKSTLSPDGVLTITARIKGNGISNAAMEHIISSLKPHFPEKEKRLDVTIPDQSDQEKSP